MTLLREINHEITQFLASKPKTQSENQPVDSSPVHPTVEVKIEPWKSLQYRVYKLFILPNPFQLLNFITWMSRLFPWLSWWWCSRWCNDKWRCWYCCKVTTINCFHINLPVTFKLVVLIRPLVHFRSWKFQEWPFSSKWWRLKNKHRYR